MPEKTFASLAVLTQTFCVCEVFILRNRNVVYMSFSMCYVIHDSHICYLMLIVV